MMKSCSCGVERDSEVSKLKLGRLGIAQIALGSRTLTIKIRQEYIFIRYEMLLLEVGVMRHSGNFES